MDEDPTLFEVDEQVGIVTLNRPAVLNALLWEQAEALATLLEEIRLRDDVRAVLLTGAGGAFCSGIDIGSVTVKREGPEPRAARMATAGPFGRVIRALLGADRPVVAAISGVASGAGLSFALACDRRFADTSARLGAVWMRRAFHPDCGITYTLPRIVGVPTALDMLATGDLYDAARAREVGLVDELVEEGDVRETALAYAKRLARGPSVVMGLTRRAVYAGLDGTLEDALHRESWGLSVAAETEDRKEGFRSWLKKRPAEYTGH